MDIPELMRLADVLAVRKSLLIFSQALEEGLKLNWSGQLEHCFFARSKRLLGALHWMQAVPL